MQRKLKVSGSTTSDEQPESLTWLRKEGRSGGSQQVRAVTGVRSEVRELAVPREQDAGCRPI